LMKVFTKPLVYFGIGFTLLSFAALVALMAITRNIIGAVIFGIFFLILCFYYWTIRNRIPFAVEVIKSVVGIIQEYPATQVLSYLTVFIKIGWICLWTFTLVLVQRFDRNLSILAGVYLLFSFYWVFEVLKNVVHVSVSGVVATAYFMSDNMPANPTLGALQRSLTTSFGSICLGSLIVSLLKTLKSFNRNDEI